jgi:hypothetical protein
MNVVSGVYLSLRDLAAAVWRDLAAGHSVGSLISGIGRTDELLAAATARLIDKFEQSGLMRSASPRRLETVEPESVALVRAGETMLSIDTFEDLKDLILSDPIHDADTQLGWPALRHADRI